jgi:hypothetical protein
MQLAFRAREKRRRDTALFCFPEASKLKNSVTGERVSPPHHERRAQRSITPKITPKANGSERVWAFFAFAGVNHSAVIKSIDKAKEKLKKFIC